MHDGVNGIVRRRLAVGDASRVVADDAARDRRRSDRGRRSRPSAGRSRAAAAVAFGGVFGMAYEPRPCRAPQPVHPLALGPLPRLLPGAPARAGRPCRAERTSTSDAGDARAEREQQQAADRADARAAPASRRCRGRASARRKCWRRSSSTGAQAGHAGAPARARAPAGARRRCPAPPARARSTRPRGACRRRARCRARRAGMPRPRAAFASVEAVSSAAAASPARSRAVRAAASSGWSASRRPPGRRPTTSHDRPRCPAGTVDSGGRRARQRAPRRPRRRRWRRSSSRRASGGDGVDGDAAAQDADVRVCRRAPPRARPRPRRPARARRSGGRGRDHEWPPGPGIPRGDTRRRDAADREAVDAVPLERDEARRVGLVEQRADAAQVAEALLADGRREQHRHARRRRAGEVAGDARAARRARARCRRCPGPRSTSPSRTGSSGVSAGKTVSRCAATTTAAPSPPTRASTLPAPSARGSRPASARRRAISRPRVGLGERRRGDRAELERVARGSLEIDRCAAQCAGAGAVSRPGG